MDRDSQTQEAGQSHEGWAVHYTNQSFYGDQKVFARTMRTEPTAAEDVLWQAIRRKAIDGFKFRRQHAIDRYIVDFYCAEARLVLEVDGGIHLQQKDKDAQRDECLEAFGLTVLRFTNEQVFQNLPNVLAVVREALHRSRP